MKRPISPESSHEDPGEESALVVASKGVSQASDTISLSFQELALRVELVWNQNRVLYDLNQRYCY